MLNQQPLENASSAHSLPLKINLHLTPFYLISLKTIKQFSLAKVFLSMN